MSFTDWRTGDPEIDARTQRILEQHRSRPRPPAIGTPEEWEAARQIQDRWHDLAAQHDRGDLTTEQYGQAVQELIETTDPALLDLAARLSAAIRDALRGELA